MKIYVAGPMRGYPDANYAAFDAATARLRSLGHEVVSPAELNRARGIPESMPTEEFNEKHLQEAAAEDHHHVSRVEAMFMLKGWETSTGARAEHAWAVFRRIPIFYQETI